jgi:hypothetical protein
VQGAGIERLQQWQVSQGQGSRKGGALSTQAAVFDQLSISLENAWKKLANEGQFLTCAERQSCFSAFLESVHFKERKAAKEFVVRRASWMTICREKTQAVQRRSQSQCSSIWKQVLQAVKPISIGRELLHCTCFMTWGAFIYADTITSENIKEPMKEVRRALLEADVSLPVARRFVANVQSKAIGQEVAKGVKPQQQLIKVNNTTPSVTSGN